MELSVTENLLMVVSKVENNVYLPHIKPHDFYENYIGVCTGKFILLILVPQSLPQMFQKRHQLTLVLDLFQFLEQQLSLPFHFLH